MLTSTATQAMTSASSRTAALRVSNLSFAYGDVEVLHDISFEAYPGELIAVVGPNGVGKSTLFKSLLGFNSHYTGTIELQGSDIKSMSSRQRAKSIAYIPQASAQTFNYSVLELVVMGASPHLGVFEQPSSQDSEHALQILDELGIAHLAYRGCSNISGGEYQLMLLARALMQNATVLVMDEPTANLDYGNQYRVMQRIAGLARRDFVVIFSAHDPNQVLLNATRSLVLEKGRIIADGTPEQVLTEQLLSRLYRIDVHRHSVQEQDGTVRVCVPVGLEPKGIQEQQYAETEEVRHAD